MDLCLSVCIATHICTAVHPACLDARVPGHMQVYSNVEQATDVL